MKTIGLDLATHTGWCVLDDGKYFASGVQDFSKRRGESNGLMFMRYRKWLSDFFKTVCPSIVPLSKFPINVVAYEQAHMRGGAATEICVGLQTHTQSLCAELGIETAPVHTHTLKRFAIGKGRGDKNQMIVSAYSWLDGQGCLTSVGMSDDEADAIHVARWAYNEYCV